MCRILLLVCASVFLFSSTLWAASFSADSVTPGFMEKSDGGKFYYRDKGTFRSEGMGMISIIKDAFVYSIVTDTKKYVVIPLEELQKASPVGVWGDAMELIKRNNLQKTGEEEIEGYSCIIYEGGATFHESQPPAPMKLWYSKKLENMIKQEVTIPLMGKMVTRLENIKIGKIDDSLFEVPKGYTKVDNMGEAMGITGMGAKGGMGDHGGKGGEMPSEEDMKKMMEQMQQMMKQQNQ